MTDVTAPLQLEEGRTATPLYWRMLRLQHVRPNGWQRALLVEGMLSIAVVLTLADIASAWTLLVLPLASVVVVKAHDLLGSMLPGRGPRPAPLPPASIDDYLPAGLAVLAFIVLRLLVHGSAGRIVVAVACVLAVSGGRWLRSSSR